MYGGKSSEELGLRTDRRRRWIREHYRLFEDDERGLWVAESLALDAKTVFDRIEHVERAAVTRLARARWGHFNFRDEAEEFSRIFPLLGAGS